MMLKLLIALLILFVGFYFLVKKIISDKNVKVFVKEELQKCQKYPVAMTARIIGILLLLALSIALLIMIIGIVPYR